MTVAKAWDAVNVKSQVYYQDFDDLATNPLAPQLESIRGTIVVEEVQGLAGLGPNSGLQRTPSKFGGSMLRICDGSTNFRLNLTGLPPH